MRARREDLGYIALLTMILSFLSVLILSQGDLKEQNEKQWREDVTAALNTLVLDKQLADGQHPIRECLVTAYCEHLPTSPQKEHVPGAAACTHSTFPRGSVLYLEDEKDARIVVVTGGMATKTVELWRKRGEKRILDIYIPDCEEAKAWGARRCIVRWMGRVTR